MIYGPYSTGWRSEKARRERLSRHAKAVLFVWLGVVATSAVFLGSLKLLGVL